MKNSSLNISVVKATQYPIRIVDFMFKIEYSMLYVLDKVTKKTIYIIVDIEDNESKKPKKTKDIMSLIRSFVQMKKNDRRVYYTFSELESEFRRERRRESTYTILNFNPNYETLNLKIAS